MSRSSLYWVQIVLGTAESWEFVANWCRGTTLESSGPLADRNATADHRYPEPSVDGVFRSIDV